MNSACTVDTSAGGPDGRSRIEKIVDALCTHWPYIGECDSWMCIVNWNLRDPGFAIFLATLTILLGIVTLSYVHPKKEGTLSVSSFCHVLLLILFQG